MPTYQYACTACGARSEVVQKFTDDPLTTCEACGGKLRKIFSAVGIVFKGPGFYRTDSRASVKEPAAAGKNGAEAGAKPSGDSASGASSAKESSSSSSSPAGNGKAPSGSSSTGSPSSSKVA